MQFLRALDINYQAMFHHHQPFYLDAIPQAIQLSVMLLYTKGQYLTQVDSAHIYMQQMSGSLPKKESAYVSGYSALLLALQRSTCLCPMGLC